MKCSPLREVIDFGIVILSRHGRLRSGRGDVNLHLRWLMLANHYEVITKDLDLHNAARETLFDGSLNFRRDYYSEDQ